MFSSLITSCSEGCFVEPSTLLKRCEIRAMTVQRNEELMDLGV